MSKLADIQRLFDSAVKEFTRLPDFSIPPYALPLHLLANACSSIHAVKRSWELGAGLDVPDHRVYTLREIMNANWSSWDFRFRGRPVVRNRLTQR